MGRLIHHMDPASLNSRLRAEYRIDDRANQDNQRGEDRDKWRKEIWKGKREEQEKLICRIFFFLKVAEVCIAQIPYYYTIHSRMLCIDTSI